MIRRSLHFASLLFAALVTEHVTSLLVKIRNKSSFCHDTEIDNIVYPLLKHVQKFYKNKMMTIYPWALSSIGALRYGGNSVKLGTDGRQLMDHDMDFLIVGPSGEFWSPQRFMNTQHELAFDMQKNGMPLNFDSFSGDWNVVTMTFSQVLQSTKWQPYDVQGRLYNAGVLRPYTRPNVMTQKFQQELGGLQLEIIANMVDNPGLQNVARNASKTLTRWARKSYANPLRSALDNGMWTEIDLFFMPGIQPDSYQAHPTKKMRFHGLTFDHPKGDKVLLYGIQMGFWDKESAGFKVASKNNICAFSKPDNIFMSDIPKSPDSVMMAVRCSNALAGGGFESFHFCH